MQANVEAAMHKLQSWLPDDLCKDYIPALAEKYIYARFDAICAPVPLTAKQIESQLLAIKKRASALLVSLAKLHGPAIDAMNSVEGKPLAKFERSLQALIARVSAAAIPNTAKINKGRDRNSGARKIAEFAVRDFHGLTGKDPECTSGHTLRDADDEEKKLHCKFGFFLADIFEALDMRDCVERFSKDAASWLKNRDHLVQHWRSFMKS